jgi:sarcosine oxidase gamma subunit
VSTTTAFLSPAGIDARLGGPLRTPIDALHVAAGADIVVRDGWRIAGYPASDATMWVADVSDLGKLELRGSPAEIDRVTGGLAFGESLVEDRARLARLTPARALVLCEAAVTPAQLRASAEGALDLTCAWAAVRLGGVARRDLLARISGLDTRPSRFPRGGVMLGSVARCPAIVVHEEPDTLLVLVAWEYGAYLWETLHDAGSPLGVAAVTDPGRLP